MADFEQKPNTGVAFTNDYKTEDRHPTYKGKGNFNGQDFEFGVWEKTSPKGRYLSFSFSEPYVKREKTQTVPIVGEIDEQGNINLDDIPF